MIFSHSISILPHQLGLSYYSLFYAFVAQLVGLFCIIWIFVKIFTTCFWLLEYFIDRNQVSFLQLLTRVNISPTFSSSTDSASLDIINPNGDIFSIPYITPTQKSVIDNHYVGIVVGFHIVSYVFAMSCYCYHLTQAYFDWESSRREISILGPFSYSTLVCNHIFERGICCIFNSIS